MSASFIKTLFFEPLEFQCSDGILKATATLVLPDGDEIEIPEGGGTFELKTPLTNEELVDKTLLKLYAFDRRKESGSYFSVFGPLNGTETEKVRYKIRLQGPAICFPLSLTYV